MNDAGGQTAPLMTDKELKQFSEFIYSELGIKITQTKKTMLQARLQRRLRTLNMKSYGQYLEYLQSLKGLEVELPQMVDAVTTNTTSFFREPKHFEYLSQVILPQWQKKHPGQTFAVWNAGCSSGGALHHGHDAHGLPRTDKPSALHHRGYGHFHRHPEKAARAVYEDEKIGTIPVEFRRKYLLRSRTEAGGWCASFRSCAKRSASGA